ncbi:hypothetical protein SNE40_014050 [Patella caerulea]|uniref:G-protein coupled receptors family 1 profile domain-containing protein n=2 Tax=Patella caerulea TaxID=87958 RepID=A0AAN8JH98_PATCE
MANGTGNIDFTNSTLEPTDHVHYSVGMAVFGIILAIWIIFVNGALIIVVLSSKERRNNNFMLHIVNIAVADIFVGILVLPIMADYLLAGSWKLGAEACQFWVITDILMCTVSIIAIVMVSYDRFIYLVWPKFYASGWKQYILGSVMILIPWVVGLGLVLPLWLNGQSMHQESDCLVILNRDFKIVSCFVSFFVPAFFAICLNFSVLLMLCVLRRRWQERRVPSAKRPARQILTVALVSLVFVVMWLPFFVLMMLQALNIDEGIPARMLELSIWLGYLNSGVTPMLWLICCRKKPEKRPDDTMRSMIEDLNDDTEMREIN